MIVYILFVKKYIEDASLSLWLGCNSSSHVLCPENHRLKPSKSLFEVKSFISPWISSQ